MFKPGQLISPCTQILGNPYDIEAQQPNERIGEFISSGNVVMFLGLKLDPKILGFNGFPARFYQIIFLKEDNIYITKTRWRKVDLSDFWELAKHV